jgi:HD-GYP domain-containing protein (c-di-GMP phosphodiesterase class II)
MQKLSFRQEEVCHGRGPLGIAWDAMRPRYWSAREAVREAEECPLFKLIAGRIKSMLVAPIYREHETEAPSDCEPYEILGYLCLFNKHRMTPGFKKGKDYVPFDGKDTQMATSLCRSISVALTYERMMESAMLAVVEALDRRDPANAEHSRRVADHVAAIGKAIYQEQRKRRDRKWKRFDLEAVGAGWYAGLLHDVGKLGLPDNALKGEGQPSRDTASFRNIHPHTSAAIVEQIIGLRPDIVRAIADHHEFFKGEDGYLSKAQGTKTSALARILGVADTYDSIRRRHGEEPGLSKMATYAQLQRLRGTKLDGYVVDAFLKTREFDELRKLLRRRGEDKKKTHALVKRGAMKNFVSQEYCCAILYHEIGPGILGIEQSEISKNTPKSRLWCSHECEFSPRRRMARIQNPIGQREPHIELTERARAVELAFLHVRWDPNSRLSGATFESVLKKIESIALKRHVLPVAMSQGLGILIPHCNCARAFSFAQEFHKAIADGYGKKCTKPVIGAAYVPNKDTVGCDCIVHCALIASAYALKQTGASGAIVFFERHQLDAVR